MQGELDAVQVSAETRKITIFLAKHCSHCQGF